MAAGCVYYLIPLRLLRAAEDWVQAGVAVAALAVLVASFTRQSDRHFHIYVGAAVTVLGSAVQRRLGPERVTQPADRSP